MNNIPLRYLILVMEYYDFLSRMPIYQRPLCEMMKWALMMSYQPHCARMLRDPSDPVREPCQVLPFERRA